MGLSANLFGSLDLFFSTFVFSALADTPLFPVVPGAYVRCFAVRTLHDVVRIDIFPIHNIFDMLDAGRFAGKSAGADGNGSRSQN